MKRMIRWTAAAAVTAAVGLLVARQMRPKPIEVDAAAVREGPMRVTLEEEGQTQARDRFVIAAPVSGRLGRISLREGDVLRSGQVVAVISPVPLDTRESAGASARVAAAEAIFREAEQRLLRAQSDRDLAARERERVETLCNSGDLPRQQLDQAKTAEAGANLGVAAARHRVDAARHDADTARASLLSADPAGPAQARPVAVRTPAGGVLLELPEPSERIVSAGTPLMTVGDPRRLEVSVDVLSTDAVNIQRGAEVELRQWGGDRPIAGRVRSVDPQAFRKVSALGVEERRVHVVVDLGDQPPQLGAGFKVEASIVIWATNRAVLLPAGALFREGSHWRAFRIRDGRAGSVAVEAGKRNAEEVQVTGGLAPGDRVVVRPPRDLESGMAVVERH